MDELKRVIDVADACPTPASSFTWAAPAKPPIPQTRRRFQHARASDSARASCGRQRSAVENTMSEMGDPSYLRAFVDETRLSGLRFNFESATRTSPIRGRLASRKSFRRCAIFVSPPTSTITTA